jgi:hypothetical protein
MYGAERRRIFVERGTDGAIETIGGGEDIGDLNFGDLGDLKPMEYPISLFMDMA